MVLVKVVEKFNFWNRIFRIYDFEILLLKRIFFEEFSLKKILFSKIVLESKTMKILFQKLNFSTTFSKSTFLKNA